MKLLLEIKDSKADFFLEVLKNFSFVKKATLIDEDDKPDFKQAIKELNQIKAGKLKSRPLSDLLNEL